MVSLQVTSKPSQTRSLGDPQFLLDAQTMMSNRLEDTQSSKGNKRRFHTGTISSVMLNHFGFVGVWVWFSSLDDFRSKSSEDGMLSMTSVSFSWSSQPASGCRGGYL